MRDAPWVIKKKRHYRFNKKNKTKQILKKKEYFSSDFRNFAQLDRSSNEKPKTASNNSGDWNFRVSFAAKVTLPQLGHSAEDLPPWTPADLSHLITALLSKHFVILNQSVDFAEETDSRQPCRVILTVHTTVPACSPRYRRRVAAGALVWCTALQLLSTAWGSHEIDLGLQGQTEYGQKCIWGQPQHFPQPEKKYFIPSSISSLILSYRFE